MATFVIHPSPWHQGIRQGQMTYQFDYGKPYTIPIYGWYLEGGDKRILVDTGEMRPGISEARQNAIDGPIHTFGIPKRKDREWLREPGVEALPDGVEADGGKTG